MIKLTNYIKDKSFWERVRKVCGMFKSIEVKIYEDGICILIFNPNKGKNG